MGNDKALVCVAIGVETLPEALALVAQESSCADVIEIRLDCLDDRQPAPFCGATETPLLFTNRPDWEGGNFTGAETERISFLETAVDCGAAYLDCELRAPEESLDCLRKKTLASNTELILSWHDFKSTPSKEVLYDTLVSMRDQGADIGKIVTTAHTHLDVLRVLSLQETATELEFPLIAFCMGRPGVISRLATVELGGYMTYCSPSKIRGTAPGQISRNHLRAMLDLLN